LIIKFGDTIIKLSYNHNRDCCENVYADFSIIKHYIQQLNAEYKQLIIKSCPEMGFILHFVADWYYDEKILIPCYNEQNGYYNDNLDLIIEVNGIKKTIDITECNQDKIC
jgi:hypothetical protein